MAESTTPADPTGTTHALLAIDKSGSMARLQDDVCGGFNAFCDDQARQDHADRIRVTVVLFDSDYEVLCTGTAPADVPRLDQDNYVPQGMTALYDAVGTLITTFERENTLGDGDRVMLVVSTDGRNNSSREYTAADINAMIDERTRTGRWMATYLGAGPDAWDGGAAMGMRSVNTTADGRGTSQSYAAVAAAATSYTRGATAAETLAVLESTATEAEPGEQQ